MFSRHKLVKYIQKYFDQNLKMIKCFYAYLDFKHLQLYLVIKSQPLILVKSIKKVNTLFLIQSTVMETNKSHLYKFTDPIDPKNHIVE